MRASAAIGIVVISLSVISVCGCTTQTGPAPSASSSPSHGYATVEVAARPTEISQQIGPSVPKIGDKFVAYNCTAKFEDATVRLTGADYWLLRDTQDNVYAPVNATFSTNIIGYPSLSIQPNDTVSGTIVYKVPQNATLKSLTYDDLVSNFPIEL